jgi:hypothetical protein
MMFYLNLSLADEHIGDVTIPTQIIEYSKKFLQAISQSYWIIQIKLNMKSITWFWSVHAFHKPLRGLLSVNWPRPDYIV